MHISDIRRVVTKEQVTWAALIRKRLDAGRVIAVMQHPSTVGWAYVEKVGDDVCVLSAFALSASKLEPTVTISDLRSRPQMTRA